MTWTLEALRLRREAILAAASRRGIRAVRVFGSVCRGEATPTSDVDFLVQVEPGRSLLDLGGFLADLEDLLGCRVDVVSERGLKERMRERVLAEAVAL
jgi:predicted nucleotidyltransferase